MKSTRLTCLITSLSLFRTRLPDPPSDSFTGNSLLIAFDKTGLSTFKLGISSAGIVTLIGDFGITFGFMAPDEKSFVIVQAKSGTYRLSFAAKMDDAMAYSLSDLNGTWYGYKFDTGDKLSSSNWNPNGWDYNEFSISNGTMTVTNPDSSRGPSSSGPQTWSGSIATNGKTGIAGMPSFEGFLLPGKNLQIGTLTVDQGVNGKAHSLIFMVK